MTEVEGRKDWCRTQELAILPITNLRRSADFRLCDDKFLATVFATTMMNDEDCVTLSPEEGIDSLFCSSRDVYVAECAPANFG